MPALYTGDFRDAGTVQASYYLNQPLMAVPLSGCGQGLPETFRLVCCDQPNVIAETVKQAEDGEDLILRFYEAFDRRGPVTLTLGIPFSGVTVCDLMEEPVSDAGITVNGQEITLPDRGVYYLYGTRGATCWGKADGFDVYTSAGLTEWEGPFPAFTRPDGFWADRNFWAPEVHVYQGRYFMLASFKSKDQRRGTQILAADTPMGPFLPHSDGPVTPRDWECLDGTLYIENGKPYMVFCHEWLQVHDGEMCAIPLRDDLHAAAGDPVVLFRASEPGWADKGAENYVTDGPFLYRSREGKLLMLWSSSRGGVYCQAVSRSADGTLLGRWHHDPKLLISRDGGHGMVFRAFDGRLLFTCHQPNQHPLERPRLIDLGGSSM